MISLEDESDSELRALVGSTVSGKYHVDRLIGRGGMGAVFQATNLSIGKRVALKFLDQESAKNREASQRFQREAEAAGMAESAHIVQIFDSGTSESGLPFLVMELLTGEDLRARLRREGRLEVSAALRIASQVLRALTRAHAAGIVHRDLKPDNVFLCARDDDPSFVKLVDFGISKVARARGATTLTNKGTVLGTAYYMSPEQAQSFHDIDGRTDLFSLGAILFEMLAGAPPHSGRTYEAVLIAICTQDAPDLRTRAPEVPAAVAALVHKALSREREQRFQSAEEFLGALSAVAGGTGVDATGPAPIISARTPNEQLATRAFAPRRYGTLVAGVIATLSGFALTAYFVAKGNASQNADPANQEAPSKAPSVALAASAAPPIVTPVASTIASAVATANAPSATSANPERPHHPPPPKPSAHVAAGLTLSTKEP
ncbi:MAG TPA: serine/threonine-protein kinase [Polyangiaceae bacterium]|jgi:serine/threonine protein kinase|nr:serine/threonine-protein kinase [Polyangiaceae bacterium]